MEIDNKKAREKVFRLWVYELSLFAVVWAYALAVFYFAVFQIPGFFFLFLIICAPYFLFGKQAINALVRMLHLRTFTKTEISSFRHFFEKIKVEIPAMYVIENPEIHNAIAFHWGGKKCIAISEKMLCMDKSKITSVIAHEVAHHQNYDLFFDSMINKGFTLGIFGTLFFGIVLSVQAFSYAMFGATLLFASCFYFFAGSAIRDWIFLWQEVRADICAAMYTEDPEAVIDTLSELCREMGMSGVVLNIVRERLENLISVCVVR